MKKRRRLVDCAHV